MVEYLRKVEKLYAAFMGLKNNMMQFIGKNFLNVWESPDREIDGSN